jgi:hypothetical protein
MTIQVAVIIVFTVYRKESLFEVYAVFWQQNLSLGFRASNWASEHQNVS